MPPASNRSRPKKLFQSTPPVAGRRCFFGFMHRTRREAFQSTPPVAGRRCRFGLLSPKYPTVVSIHASRCWEAMQGLRARKEYLGWFQSTPPVAGRRCLTTTKTHTRGSNSFNPRLPLLGGDAATVRGARTPLAFQSTPPVAGRRCQKAEEIIQGPIMFQSTPPVAGRRCRQQLARHQDNSKVSIHASRCWEAMHTKSGINTNIRQFQSTPPVAGRRCSAHPDRRPRPLSVSIHASRCWEAMPWRVILRMFTRAFQSTPPVAGRRCRVYAD